MPSSTSSAPAAHGAVARGLPTQEHRLALLRPVATRRDLGPAPRPPSPQGPHDGEALPPPNVGKRDSQSIDTTSGGEQRGRDNAKNIDGRKRHIVVDSLGLLLAVLVTAASVDDAAAAPALFARLDGRAAASR